MDSIDVPIYSQSEKTPIDDALLELRKQGRGGLLVNDKGDYRLLLAGDLLRCRQQGIALVQQIPDGEPVAVITQEIAITHSLDLENPSRTWHQFETVMDQFQRSYSLPLPNLPHLPHAPHVTRQTRVVVSRHEGLGEMLRMTGGYECNGTPKHFFPAPRVTPNQICPEYPECSRSDGKTPTIVASI